jgi:hypothetical protein
MVVIMLRISSVQANSSSTVRSAQLAIWSMNPGTSADPADEVHSIWGIFGPIAKHATSSFLQDIRIASTVVFSGAPAAPSASVPHRLLSKPGSSAVALGYAATRSHSCLASSFDRLATVFECAADGARSDDEQAAARTMATNSKRMPIYPMTYAACGAEHATRRVSRSLRSRELADTGCIVQPGRVAIT